MEKQQNLIVIDYVEVSHFSKEDNENGKQNTFITRGPQKSKTTVEPKQLKNLFI